MKKLPWHTVRNIVAGIFIICLAAAFWIAYDTNSDIYEKAVASLDYLECDRITDEPVRDGCYAFVAVNKKDVSICGRILSDRARDNCLVTAPEDPNPAACQKVMQREVRDHCFYNVVSFSSNDQYCESIQDAEKKDSCFLQRLAYALNASICSKVSLESSHAQCITQIAIKNADLGICGQLSGAFERTCISRVSLEGSSIENCSGLMDVDDRQACYLGLVESWPYASFNDASAGKIHELEFGVSKELEANDIFVVNNSLFQIRAV